MYNRPRTKETKLVKFREMFWTELHCQLLGVGFMREKALPHILMPAFRVVFDIIGFHENILSYGKQILPKNVTGSECLSGQKFPSNANINLPINIWPVESKNTYYRKLPFVVC